MYILLNITNEIKINDKEITYIPIKYLIPYENNARTHSDEQIDKLKNSLKEFGFINPVIIDENNMILVGHGRVMAGKELGIFEVPCIRINHLSEDKKRAYILADNKLSDMAGWDLELLNIELESIELDMSLFGFDELELVEIEEDIEIIEDEIPDIPKEPKAKYGDIYKLGNHRLMCGDSTKVEDVKKLMNGNIADLIVTDPPYGMNAVSNSGVLSKTYKTDILNDDTNDVAIKSFNLVNKLFKNINQIWWGSNYYTECLPSAECWIVWDKNNGGSDQTDCELAWTNFRSVVRQFTMASEKINRVHPTQKPVKLITDIFYKFDKNKSFNKVLDLFGGSGSTLIACEQLNRNCYMMELDTKYIDVIIERWEKFTGEKAVLLNE